MEPKNHLFEKENHLPNLHIIMFQPLIFGGVGFRSTIWDTQPIACGVSKHKWPYLAPGVEELQPKV